MTRLKAGAWLIATISAGVLLAACGKPAPDPGAGPESGKGPAKPAARKPATAGAQMVAAVSAGKSSTVIGVYFWLGNVPKVGTGLPVDISVIPRADFTTLRATFESQDGLTLISGESLETKSEVKAETTLQHQLVLMPARDGVYVVTATVDTEGSEGMVSRIFSIPVIVATAEASAPANSPSAQPATAPET